MADNNYIEITARLNETASTKKIQEQLDTIQNTLKLQLNNVVIGKNGLSSLQSSIDTIQQNLHLNISSVAIDQSQTVKQAQAIAQNISNAMNASVKPSNNVTRAFDISDNVAKNLKKRYSDVAVLAQELQNRFGKVGTVTTEVLSHENQLIDKFRVTITNADGAVEKLVYHLKEIDGTKRHAWEVTSATSTDNNIKLQEQSIKQAQQAARRLNSELNSSFKTLKHDVQIMDNLSHRQVFNTNASAPDVETLLQRIQDADSKFNQLKHDFETKPASEGLLASMRELNGVVTTITSDSHNLARALSQSMSNVNPEAELNNLKTLMNNLKASDVEVDKLKADYGELVGLFMQAKDTGNFTTFFTQLETFKSKFTEAKSEVRATNAEIADLEKMAKSFTSNKMNTFFDKNSDNAQVNALKTEINGLINEWTSLNAEIETTGHVTHSMQGRLDELKVKMQNATTAADTLQKNIKEVANAQRLATQKQSLDARITSWLQNNTRASQETIAKLKEMQAQIQSADAQTMTNLNNQFRQVTANARAAGEAGKTLGDTIREKLGKFAGWFSIATVVMRAVNELKNMYREVVELDTALVDLRKTTDATNAQLEDFYFEANKIGKQLGVTTKDVIQATSSWSRLGYSIKDAQEMAKTSSIFASISPGMDIEQATDGLVSAMKSFGITADEALDGIASKINIIGNTQAVSNTDIVNFLTRSSAAMAEANSSLEDTIALGTAITEITRDAQNAGQVMKTMSMRIRGIDEETEEYSEDVAQLTGKIADLTKTAKTPGGISLFTDSTKSTYKSTVQILREISEIYDDLTDKQQAEFACVRRNVHRRTHLIAGKALEPCTTIAEKSRYDGLTTQGLAVHAEKYPNVIPRP